jgi:hypothetical protein
MKERVIAYLIAVLALLVVYAVMTALVSAQIAHVTDAVLIRDERFLEFGTAPPRKCSELSGVRWQECMGVGSK